jgi:hypothetical protein
METVGTARSGPWREDNGSDGAGGQLPLAGEAVAPEWPGTGAPAEARGAPQQALPGVQSDPLQTRTVGRDTYTVPPQASLQAALVKARDRDLWRLVSWQPDKQQWWCPSRTTPAAHYALTVRPGTAKGDPWWIRLRCNCDAETSGRYMACWHKAAVAYREERWKVMRAQREERFR